MGTRESNRNQIYLARAEAKTFKYLVLNGNLSPENMGMDLTVFKSINEEYNESSKVPLLLDIK